jgi:excisionase family DNA binding protein
MAHGESWRRTKGEGAGGHSGLAQAPDILTVRELGEILRIGRNQAYALVKSGRVECCRIGKGSIRVPKAALERFLRSQPESAADGEASALRGVGGRQMGEGSR